MARSSRWKDAAQPVQPQPPAPAAGAPAPPAPPSGAVPPTPPVATPATDAAAPAAEALAPVAAPAPAAGASAVEGEVAELKSTLADLQATVASLVEKTTVAPPPPSGGGDTAEVSRIITMANRTAEATMEEARNEASSIVAAAKTQSFEIIRMARELADRELAAERARVARSTEAWLAKRAEVTEKLRRLETALSGYQTGLGDVDASIKAAVAELEADEVPEPVIDELPAPDPAAFVGSDLPENGVAAESSTDSTIDLTDDTAAPPSAAEEAVVAGDDKVPSSAGTVPADDVVTRTSLFGGGVAEPPATSPDTLAAAWPQRDRDRDPEPSAPEDSGGGNLRPGLFGR